MMLMRRARRAPVSLCRRTATGTITYLSEAVCFPSPGSQNTAGFYTEENSVCNFTTRLALSLLCPNMALVELYIFRIFYSCCDNVVLKGLVRFRHRDHMVKEKNKSIPFWKRKRTLEVVSDSGAFMSWLNYRKMARMPSRVASDTKTWPTKVNIGLTVRNSYPSHVLHSQCIVPMYHKHRKQPSTCCLNFLRDKMQNSIFLASMLLSHSNMMHTNTPTMEVRPSEEHVNAASAHLNVIWCNVGWRDEIPSFTEQHPQKLKVLHPNKNKNATLLF